MTLAGHVQQMALVEVYEQNGVINVRDSLPIVPALPGAIFYTGLDTGTPSVRASSSPRPDGDGTFDQTTYSDAKALSLSLVVVDGAFNAFPNIVLPPGLPYSIDDMNHAAFWVDQLSAWMLPSRRNMRLYITYTGQARSRYVNIRPAAMSAPIVLAERRSRNVQMQWVVPDGRSFAFDTGPTSTIDGRSQVTIGQATVDVLGTAVPFVLPLTFPDAGPGAGQLNVFSRGVAPAPFVAQINAGVAAVTDPRLTISHFDAAGFQDYPVQSIGLSGYTLPANQFITVDTRSRLIYLGYDPTQRLDGYLGNVAWPVLRPGRTKVSLTGTTSSSNANVVITWADAYLV